MGRIETFEDMEIWKEAEMIDRDTFTELNDEVKKLSRNIQGFRKYLKDYETKKNI